METGQAYLVHFGDWYTFVGRVVKQCGPFTYLMESVSKCSDTNNGDVWQAMAGGDKRLREAATWVHTPPAKDRPNGVRLVLPLTIAAFEWVGELPWKAK